MKNITYYDNLYDDVMTRCPETAGDLSFLLDPECIFDKVSETDRVVFTCYIQIQMLASRNRNDTMFELYSFIAPEEFVGMLNIVQDSRLSTFYEKIQAETHDSSEAIYQLNRHLIAMKYLFNDEEPHQQQSEVTDSEL